jgi:hypothetical protein
MSDTFAYFRAQERHNAAVRAQEDAERAEAARTAQHRFDSVEAPAKRAEIRAEIARRMVLAGVPKAQAESVVQAHDDRITIRRAGLGAAAYIDGTVASVRLDAVAHELAEHVNRLAYGPDPAALLEDRLAGAGVPRSAARTMARSHVTREADGAILYTSPNGAAMRGTDPEDTRPLDWAARALVQRFEAQRERDAQATPATAEAHRNSVVATASYTL